ncbi:caspase family protein [Micromonospora sp. LOL_021]|uniref:caspase family protein n=1 Tax=Micromonospora sp. LOL_021 TaxID=3345417 RepID=UPI003A8C62D1
MTRRALLVGSQTDGLTGVHNDVESIAAALDGRGFTISCLTGDEANRAGILAGYEKLIGQSTADDTVLFYYSGHGGYAHAPEPAGDDPAADDPGSQTTPGRRPADLQFIVPTDYSSSTEDEFRGITSFELSVLQARLTKVTQNVVVALDCCHSAHQSRDPDLRVKGLDRQSTTRYEQISRHLAALRRDGLAVDRRVVTGNPYSVRLVACAPEQFAYEYRDGAGQRIGMFTEALIQALAAAEDLPVTWFTLMEAVRRQVLRRASNQRPEVEGPSRRLLFSLQETDPIAGLPVAPTPDGRVVLPGAPLLGVELHDEFTVMPAELPVDEETSVGTAVVDRLGALAAQAELTLRTGWSEVPATARAYRTRSAAPALPVRVTDPDAADLVAAIGTSTLVRLADADEPCTVEVRPDRAGNYQIHDRTGPLHSPRPAGPGTAARLLTDLERVARATGLRALGEDPRCVLDTPLTFEWGRVVDGVEVPMRSAGEVVHDGDLVYVRVRNAGAEAVYVSLLDIGVSARIENLTNFAPSGFRLEPGKEYLVGYDALSGVLRGVRLNWPAGIVPAAGRPETVLLIATSRPQDVGLLQQDGIRTADRTELRRRVPRRDQSPLERVLDQLGSGGMREMSDGFAPEVRYALRTIEFSLSPTARPPAESVRFLIDERPDRSRMLFRARGSAARTVAVRLDEVLVHRNRALRSADIRVDAVVLTGTADDDGAVPYRAETARFRNVRDGERLPLDRMLVYHGPAVDYLDLAVWVSRDTRDSRALSDLLRDELNGPTVQAAGAQLLGLAVAAPQAAAAAAAIGAGAVVVNLAYRLLLDAVGDSIGLYRTSLLATEEFGVGRHPAVGNLRAQDFSFSYTVEAVD